MDRGAEGGGFLHGSPIDDTATRLEFVVLTCASESYAVEIGQVREIIRVPRITWIPGARSPVRGLINLRGSIVTVIDLAELLAGNRLEPDESSRIVIVESDELSASLLVAAVSSVTAVSPGELQPPLATMDEMHRKLISRQATIGQLMVGLLDVDILLKQAQRLQGAT